MGSSAEPSPVSGVRRTPPESEHRTGVPALRDWKVWLKGLVAAAISSSSNAIAVVVADPMHFSPAEVGGFRKLGVVVLVSAIVGAALYLKQSPVPDGAR